MCESSVLTVSTDCSSAGQCPESSVSVKKFEDDAPFGQAPYLEVNGKKYGQSVAIASYLARELADGEPASQLPYRIIRRFVRLTRASPIGSLTLADLYVYDVMYSLGKIRNYDAGAAFPELQTLKDKVESNPALKQYLANRKDTLM
ncbi:hypothetical protein BaRGS_00003662 [Batillaria attramentaria]|uniref:GST N-terminal domain-containing protein n=1 Tax=Batillaria attramentaria TaxID=370345 RepID=A0ABD0M1J1_9CAEN